LIPQIVDIIKDPEGFICLIMHKYKCSLEDIIQEYIRGEMSEEEILRIIAMIGLVHSLGGKTIYLLTDFGISKHKSITHDTTISVKMTEAYASIE
jgi:hypothetical protein